MGWTSYPVAKADRLPLVVNRWSEVEHQLALLAGDLRWLEQPGLDLPSSLVDEVLAAVAELD